MKNGELVKLTFRAISHGLYPFSMTGVMVFGNVLPNNLYDVLCEDGQIRVVNLSDIVAV